MTDFFVYGTLQIPEVFQAVTGRLAPAEPARLAEHARYRLKGLTYPGLVAEPGAETEGLLFRRLGPEEVARLDAFEDDFYERPAVSVTTLAGETVRAETYVIPAASRSRIDPCPWSLDEFRRQSLQSFLDRCRAAGP